MPDFDQIVGKRPKVDFDMGRAIVLKAYPKNIGNISSWDDFSRFPIQASYHGNPGRIAKSLVFDSETTSDMFFGVVFRDDPNYAIKNTFETFSGTLPKTPDQGSGRMAETLVFDS